MAGEKKASQKEEAPKVVKLKKKVVTIGDYLPEVSALLVSQGSVNGMTSKANICIAMIYERNTSVEAVVVKGDAKFICDA